MTKTIGDRYLLHDKLGEGGMGVVFRADDRLTGQTVALKQVRVNRTMTSADSTDLRLALAREFQMLASLRHPHIISVLDYSFDAAKQPYFTMTLLEDPQDIDEFARPFDLHTRLQLLIQVLQALAYLHRRGIVHRDLKPSNIMVHPNGQVRVVDFGLAVEQGQDTEVVGTLHYMAPEVLEGKGSSVEADLYAVGTLAYQMVTERHPFSSVNAVQLMMDVLYNTPDFSLLPESLRPVIEKLMAKDPTQRYSSTNSVIHDLCTAAGLPIPEENAEIRESFLQAASFVGRDVELHQLLQAFQQSAMGVGSLWLIAGESGVGKSRLLDELRIRAIISEFEAGGAIVLQGQAVESGGMPYSMWREPLRRLLLSTPEIDLLEASILKAIVPDIAQLLQIEVPDVPVLAGSAQQERLFLTIVNLFRKQTRPMLLILEDLHWANENLNPLKTLADRLSGMRLLVVGSYRDDDKPDLPDSFSSAQLVKLKRFDMGDVSELSASILGTVGQQQNVVDLLLRETEGNAFFVVEVIRTLAEEAGSLEDIGRITLPIEVFAGGIQALIRRRLEKIPQNAQRLLQWAALVGRRIDRALLQTLMRQTDYHGMRTLDRWFTLCANAAVLEPVGNEWRFTHDKLRATILSSINEHERPALHRQVAEGIEAAHPNDHGWASSLVEHWRIAGVNDKVVAYTLIAAEQAMTVSSFQDALTMSQRALELLPEAGTEQQHLLLMRYIGDAQQALGDYESSRDSFQQCLDFAQKINDQQGYMRALINFGGLYIRRGELETAKQYLHDGLGIARLLSDDLNLGKGLNNLGMIAWQQNDFATAVIYLREAREIAARFHHHELLAASYSNLGIVAWQEGDYATARVYFEQMAATSREIGDRRSLVLTYVNLGGIAGEQGEIEASRDYLIEGAALARSIGDRRGLVLCLINLGEITDQLRNPAQARASIEEAKMLAEQMGDALHVAFAHFYLGNSYYRSQEFEQAKAVFQEAQQGFEQVGYGTYITQVNAMLGLVTIELGDLSAARRYLDQALRKAVEIANHAQQLLALLGYANLLPIKGQIERGAELIGLVDADPLLDQAVRQWIVKPTRARAEKLLTPEALAAAAARGAGQELTSVVNAMLA